GNIAVLFCFLLPTLLGLIAFAVDYGFLLYVRTDLQRVADQAAIAATQDLTPASNGSQNLDLVRQTIREYASLNAGYEFTILETDIQLGRFDPETVYTDFAILDDGIFDTVKVTVRRNDLTNSSVSLFFARIFGSKQQDVSATATAILQKAVYLGPGTDILPIAISSETWDAIQSDDVWSIYGDGRLEDEFGDPIPGNWGTVDIGPTSNSTKDLVDQINNGLAQSDLDALQTAGTIDSVQWIDSQDPITLNGDTGLSAGIKSAVQNAHTKEKLVPIYDATTGHGGNLYYDIVGWGVVQIVDSTWQGNKKTKILVRKSYIYDGDLRPSPDLSDTTNIIEAAYTSPVLVQ
ncbi:MAG: pilus assembly protein TadG-related protein, partial [Pirellulaceae bacterium]|nr:pilus assembly protein TadG-related protein [Pirellulaceae bacterium]